MRNAIAPAIQIHGPANTLRCGVRIRPKTIPAPKISMEYLFSRPNPARMPNQIQSFWSPVFTMRIISQAQPIQNSGSNAFIDRKS